MKNPRISIPNARPEPQHKPERGHRPDHGHKAPEQSDSRAGYHR